MSAQVLLVVSRSKDSFQFEKEVIEVLDDEKALPVVITQKRTLEDSILDLLTFRKVKSRLYFLHEQETDGLIAVCGDCGAGMLLRKEGNDDFFLECRNEECDAVVLLSRYAVRTTRTFLNEFLKGRT